jgi:hypothetical protein
LDGKPFFGKENVADKVALENEIQVRQHASGATPGQTPKVHQGNQQGLRVKLGNRTSDSGKNGPWAKDFQHQTQWALVAIPAPIYFVRKAASLSQGEGFNMFIGHWAPAMVAATHKNAPSLPVLFIAAQLVDWAFFLFLVFGVEAMRVTPGISAMNPMDLYHMPYTHSLLGSAAWAAGFSALIFAASRSRTAAIIGGLVVLSHWLLDLLVHVPDLTIAGGPPKLGFGLWNYPIIEMPLELLLTFGALWFYANRFKPKTAPLITLGAVMLALQAFNWFGPVEPDVTTGTSLLALFAYGLVTIASWWVHRSARMPKG